MDKPRPVLAALDFSDYTDQTLMVAAELADCLGAELVALNVIHQRMLDELKFVEGTTELLRAEAVVAERRKDREVRLAALLQEQGVRARVMISIGVPWEAILDAAAELNAGYIVMGTKGRSDLSRTLLGSNADKVYRHSPVTVISARGGHSVQRPVVRGTQSQA